MSATPTHDSTTDSTRHAIANSPRLYLAFELGWNQWKRGFAPGLDAQPRSQARRRQLRRANHHACSLVPGPASDEGHRTAEPPSTYRPNA